VLEQYFVCFNCKVFQYALYAAFRTKNKGHVQIPMFRLANNEDRLQ